MNPPWVATSVCVVADHGRGPEPGFVADLHRSLGESIARDPLDPLQERPSIALGHRCDVALTPLLHEPPVHGDVAHPWDHDDRLRIEQARSAGVATDVMEPTVSTGVGLSFHGLPVGVEPSFAVGIWE